MTPPSLDVAREILLDAAAKGRAAADPSGEVVATAIDVVLAELARSPVPRAVPFYDEDGRKIGDARIDGCTIVAKFTDERAAGKLRASVDPVRNVSVGYSIAAEPALPPGALDFKSEPAHKLGPDAVAVSNERRSATAGCAEHACTAATHGTTIPPDALHGDMLPCPFCGRGDRLAVDSHPDRALGGPEVTLACVRCGHCGCAGPAWRGGAGTRREAIAHWNRRPGSR